MSYKKGLRQKSTMVALAMLGRTNGAPEELISLVDFAANAGFSLQELADLLNVSRTAIRGWMNGHEVSLGSRDPVARLARALGVGLAFGVLPTTEAQRDPILRLLQRAVSLRIELDEMMVSVADLRARYELAVPADVAASYDAEEESDEADESEEETDEAE